MKERLSLCQQSCDQMVSGATILCDSIVSHLHSSITTVCAATDEARELLETVDGLFEDESNVKPFMGLSQISSTEVFEGSFGLQV